MYDEWKPLDRPSGDRVSDPHGPRGHPAGPLDPAKVEAGEVCARCGVEFDGQHGRPVLCWSCHGGNDLYKLTKAWLEEKAK